MSEPSKDRRRNDTREKMLKGTLRLLVEEGYPATTTSRIAAEAGIRQSSFYRHFKSRDECIAEAIRAAGAGIADRLNARRAGFGDVRTAAAKENRERGFRLLLEQMLANPEISSAFVKLQDEDDAGGEATREVLGRIRDDFVRDLPVFGVTPIPDDAAMRAEMLMALVARAVNGIRRGDYDMDHVVAFLREQTGHMFPTPHLSEEP